MQEVARLTFACLTAVPLPTWCCCIEVELPQLQPLPHLLAAPVAGYDGLQDAAAAAEALDVWVMTHVDGPQPDHVQPALALSGVVDSNLEPGDDRQVGSVRRQHNPIRITMLRIAGQCTLLMYRLADTTGPCCIPGIVVQLSSS